MQTIINQITKKLHVLFATIFCTDIVKRASCKHGLRFVYSALGLIAVHSIYISTLGFLLAKPVRKGFRAGCVHRVCVARAVPCNIIGELFKNDNYEKPTVLYHRKIITQWHNNRTT